MNPIDFFPHMIRIYEKTGLETAVRQDTEDGRCNLVVHVTGGYLDIYRIWGEDRQARAVQVITNLDRKEAVALVERVFEALGIRTTWQAVEVPIATQRPSFLLEPVLPVDLSILPPWSPLPPGGLA